MRAGRPPALSPLPLTRPRTRQPLIPHHACQPARRPGAFPTGRGREARPPGPLAGGNVGRLRAGKESRAASRAPSPAPLPAAERTLAPSPPGPARSPSAGCSPAGARPPEGLSVVSSRRRAPPLLSAPSGPPPAVLADARAGAPLRPRGEGRSLAAAANTPSCAPRPPRLSCGKMPVTAPAAGAHPLGSSYTRGERVSPKADAA